MHASHLDPRVLTAGFAALLVAFLLALVPSLPTIDSGTSGGSSAAPATTAPAAHHHLEAGIVGVGAHPRDRTGTGLKAAGDGLSQGPQ